MVIKGILVSSLAPFENHMANNGEKLLGNASSIKRRPDGRVYISGIGHRTTRIQRRGVEKEVKLFIFRRLVVCL